MCAYLCVCMHLCASVCMCVCNGQKVKEKSDLVLNIPGDNSVTGIEEVISV